MILIINKSLFLNFPLFSSFAFLLKFVTTSFVSPTTPGKHTNSVTVIAYSLAYQFSRYIIAYFQVLIGPLIFNSYVFNKANANNPPMHYVLFFHQFCDAILEFHKYTYIHMYCIYVCIHVQILFLRIHLQTNESR